MAYVMLWNAMVGITRSKVIADVLQALKIGKMFEGFRRLVFPAFDFKTSILSKAAEKATGGWYR